MEQAVTHQTFFWIIGAIISLNTLIVGYWIKEIKGVGRALDKHKEDDEKEFNNAQRVNDRDHADIKALIYKEINDVTRDVIQINTKLDYVTDFIKEIKKEVKEKEAK